MWTFDLKVKLVGFIIWLCVQATAFLSFDTVILCLARECITMVKCVAYISELYIILTFALKIKIIFSPWIWLSRLTLLFDIGIPHFGIWVYHHETTWCVHSWPLYELDLWPICTHSFNFCYAIDLNWEYFFERWNLTNSY